MPKSTFVLCQTLQLVVTDAVICFNDGSVTKCNVLERLNIKPENSWLKDLRKSTKIESRKQTKKLRKKTKKEDQKKAVKKKMRRQ